MKIFQMFVRLLVVPILSPVFFVAAWISHEENAWSYVVHFVLTGELL